MPEYIREEVTAAWRAYSLKESLGDLLLRNLL